MLAGWNPSLPALQMKDQKRLQTQEHTRSSSRGTGGCKRSRSSQAACTRIRAFNFASSAELAAAASFLRRHSNVAHASSSESLSGNTPPTRLQAHLSLLLVLLTQPFGFFLSMLPADSVAGEPLFGTVLHLISVPVLSLVELLLHVTRLESWTHVTDSSRVVQGSDFLL